MKLKLPKIVTPICLGLALAFVLLPIAHSRAASDVQLPQIKVLKKSRLHHDDQTEVWIREHTYQPGWKAPKHRHNSDLYIYVISGSFELITEQDGRIIYTAGQAVLMKPGLVMDAGNASNMEDLKLAVFQVGEVDKPFVVPVE